MAEPESTQAQKRYKTADGTEATKRLLEKFDEHTDWEKFVFGLRDERCFPISKPQNQTRPHITSHHRPDLANPDQTTPHTSP